MTNPVDSIRFGRLFLTVAPVFCLTAAWGSEPIAWPYKDSKDTGKIIYINETIPEVSVTPYSGTTYEDMIPDTVDVAEMARLSINVLTCATNHKQDHEQYFSLYLGNPLRMAHNFSDWCTPKYMEALPLLRAIDGDGPHRYVDRIWMEVILKSLGPDGLYYFPIQGKPWYGKELWWAKGIARPDGTIFETGPADEEFVKSLDTYAVPHAHPMIEKSGMTQFSHPQPCGRVMNVLNIYYMIDGNPLWKRAMEKMIDRLLELAVHKDDYCFFPPFLYEPNAKYDPADPRVIKLDGVADGEINGRSIKGPALFYKLTGYEPARELARKLTNYMRYHSNYYGSNGEFISDKHFHAHTNYIFQMLEYATAVDDKELQEYIRKSYEWAKSRESGCSALTGFIPEAARDDYPTSEGCAVADMVAWALKLSHFGIADYYEDAERWIRNYFAEIQMTAAKMDHMVRWGRTKPAKRLLYNETDDRVAERNIGGFGGWASGNEWLAGDERGTDNLIMHCCTGNATRAVFYAWRHILDYQDGELRVNMLLNRASAWADVYSHVPYQGRVDIKMKTDCRRVLVHAPEWIPTRSDRIKVKVDNKKRSFVWQDRYLNCGKVKKDQTVVVTFPIAERTVTERMGVVDYTLIVKGNTVVHIDPPGRHCPLFRRAHYRENETRWRKIERFVCDQVPQY